MLHTHRESKQSRQRWARTVLFGSVLTSLSWGGANVSAQVRQLIPPAPSSIPTAPSKAGQQNPNPVVMAQAVTLATSMPQLSVSLKTYEIPSEFIGTFGAQLQVLYHSNPDVRITTDPKTGQLMVMAPEGVQAEVASHVSAFMRTNKIPAGDRGVRLASTQQQGYSLRNLSWRELEDSIQRLAGGRLTTTTERNGELASLQVTNSSGRTDVIQIDRRQNKVNLLGSGASVSGWTQVVYSLDQGQADPNRLTQIVPLTPAEPRRVRRAMQLVQATIQNQAGGAQAGGAQAEAQVELADEERAMAMGSIESLGADSGLFGDVQIEFIEEIDLVIIRGNKRDVERTLKVIDEIKKQARETQPEVEIFQLQHANAEAVATLVTQLYDAVYAPRQGTVSITALGQPNALLLIGRKEVVNSVKELVSKIDQPLGPQDQLKVIPLRHASSVDVETRIREFFVNRPGDDSDDRTGLGTRVKVLADYRTNSLIVQASPREMVEVEALINKLDVETAETENSVRVFRLKNTLAEDLQSVIEEVIGGQTTGADESQATPPSGKLSIVTVDGNKVESGILAGVIITADPTVNALVVRAPAQSMALIERLITELDSLPSAEAVIKVFQLQNGDATTLAQTLQGLFGLAVTAGQGAQGNFLNSLTQSNLTGGGEGSLVPLQIAAEARTNSVIVSGSKSNLTVIEALVLRLDEDVAESRRTEVIWLRNATALNVSTALQTYFQQLTQAQQNLNNGINQIISAQELVNRQVFVVPEEATNSLLLSASPEYFQTAMSLIERLDRRPPMVSIQVLVAEVQLDDGFELGAEWGLQDGLLFDRQSATGGTLSSPVFALGSALAGPSNNARAGRTQNVAGQGLTSFGVGRSNAAGQGGLVLSASSEAVGVLVRALQTANRIQVLNRPQLTTLDSQVATAQVGASVPRVTGVSQAALGTPQQVITTPEEVGLLLSVLPRVNPDGLILMQVGVENSSVGDPNAGIPIGFGANGEVIRSPIINRTRADTVVSAYSGQTVVFAGLISKSRSSSRSQIPFLGSLPWIGAAFRFDVESEQRKELMVVLTPRLIQTDEEYDTLKHVETSRMSWCLADVLNLHGDVGLSGGNGLWGPAHSAVIYPDMQTTLPPDRAMPAVRDNFGYGNSFESYPLQQGNTGLIESSPVPELDSGAALRRNPGNLQVQPVSFGRPAPTTNNSFPVPGANTVPGVQVGGYR
jgi:general secretion pathway protein D